MQRIDLSSTPLMGAVERAVAALEQGQLVIYPTETSYGIAADATRLEAIERLRAYKGNRQNKPFSIVMADQTMAESFVTLTDTARRLYTEHLPGPLTVISDSLPETVAPGVANADGSIGVRIPDYPVILEVVKQFGRPVTATSANPSDGKQPYSIDELLAELTDEQKKPGGHYSRCWGSPADASHHYC
ncbi:L-threonylcarbamoyladenylate synthase [Candidatus Woesebacteria bacterium]|nr:L-threonylcarbamoyladenylate synthase [Candidatus Woesebacteria bacterium]